MPYRGNKTKQFHKTTQQDDDKARFHSVSVSHILVVCPLSHTSHPELYSINPFFTLKVTEKAYATADLILKGTYAYRPIHPVLK